MVGAGDSGGGGWSASGVAAGQDISKGRAGEIDVWAGDGIWQGEGGRNRAADRSDISEDDRGVEGEVSGVEGAGKLISAEETSQGVGHGDFGSPDGIGEGMTPVVAVFGALERVGVSCDQE